MNFNIGVIIFVIIFIYLVFNVFSYLTETHISVYEVEQGTIAVNNVYNVWSCAMKKSSIQIIPVQWIIM